MQHTSIYLLVLALFISGGLATQDHTQCSASASIARSSTSLWSAEGRNFSVYNLNIVNLGSCEITSLSVQLTLSANTKIESTWNLKASEEDASMYSLTNFGNAIPTPGSYSGAGLILSFVESASISISVHSTICSTACTATHTSNATAMPTHNATAAPTPNATAIPTPGAPSAELLLSLTTAPTELDREKLLSDSDFVFDFVNAMTGITKSAGGKTVAATPSNFPALIGHGVAMTVGYIEACGINLPHTHPRATEINFIVSGEFQAGFFLENGARFIGNTLKPGMATVFPQGSIHFELNLGCEPAVFVAAFNNQDPGVQTTTLSFFGLPADIIAASANISSITSVEELAAHLPQNPAIAMQECKAKCGL